MSIQTQDTFKFDATPVPAESLLNKARRRRIEALAALRSGNLRKRNIPEFRHAATSQRFSPVDEIMPFLRHSEERSAA